MKHRPMQLLMVDDNSEDVELFQRLFEEIAPEIEFSSATSAAQVLTLIGAGNRRLPDLILLDLKMPATDGHDLLAYLKARPELKPLPVVILSASDHEDDVFRAYHGLASAYLIKPTTHQGCRAMVETLHGFWQHVSFPHIRN
ncbi:response regulator (plasmid) [Deinococcus radiomollis]|uniref:response regulator n=1 Tax=Deinococcus radiomollis TaxID=468916 RepID=UPI003891F495